MGRQEIELARQTYDAALRLEPAAEGEGAADGVHLDKGEGPWWVRFFWGTWARGWLTRVANP